MKHPNRTSLLQGRAQRLIRLCLLFGAVAILCHATKEVSAESLSSREYQIKAAYLFNFIKYVDWPTYGDTITIGVLGNNPFGSALTSLNGKTVKGRRLLTRDLAS